MWFWIDWGDNSDYGVLQNCWYYLAQKAAVEMAMLCGNETDAEGFRENMKSIEANFAKLWDGNAYNSGQFKRPKDAPDDRANAMAVICGLAPQSNYSAIKEVLMEQQFASPYMEKYVLEALCLMGEDVVALERMKNRYNAMVEAPFSTLWEFWETGGMGTYNHGWNAPNTILSQYIAGIAPLEPGWLRYQIKPHVGQLTSVKVRVPSVKGNIDVDILRSETEFVLNLVSPEETTAVVCIPKTPMVPTVISINGSKVWEKGTIVNKIGGIIWLGESSNSLRFSVDPGDWTLIAR